MRALAVFALAAACGKPAVTPAPVGPTPTPDPKPTVPVTTTPQDQVDGGVFVSIIGGTKNRRETFSIRRLPSGNLLLAASTENLIEKGRDRLLDELMKRRQPPKK